MLKMVLEVLTNMIGQEKGVRHKNWKEGDEIIIICKQHNWTCKSQLKKVLQIKGISVRRLSKKIYI